jgi:hypothetical protein
MSIFIFLFIVIFLYGLGVELRRQIEDHKERKKNGDGGWW